MAILFILFHAIFAYPKNSSEKRIAVKGFFLTFLFVISVFWGLSASTVSAQPNAKQQGRLFSAKKTEETADLATLVPWREMSSAKRNTAQNVINNRTIFRQMPTQLNFCDKNLYQFLLKHPDVVVGIWEHLGATQITLREIEPGQFLLKESTGTTGRIDVFYQSDDICIIYNKGEFVSPVTTRPIQGESLLIFYSQFTQDRSGRPIVQSKMDCYVKIHNSGAEILAKLLIPIVGKIADANFEQTIDFVASLSETAEMDSESIQNIAFQLEHVRPSVAREFSNLVEDVYLHSVERFMIATGRFSSPKRDFDEVTDKNGEQSGKTIALRPVSAQKQLSPGTKTRTTESSTPSVIVPMISSNSSEFVNAVSTTSRAASATQPVVKSNANRTTVSSNTGPNMEPVKSEKKITPTTLPVPKITRSQ